MTIPLAANDGGSPAGSLIFLLLLGVVFYLVAVRPNRRRMRAMQQTQAALEPGREVMTTAGIYGTVVAVDDDAARLEVAPGVVIRVARGAVVRVVDDTPQPVTTEPRAQD